MTFKLPLILLTLASPLLAQDTRTVLEPTIPPTCTLLKSQSPTPIQDESRLDTARLQSALSSCPAGHAVELASAAQNTAFLTGPIDIPSGVTLLIDRGVTLFASRDPRLYETSPGSCGIVTKDNPHGCKPVIEVLQAPNAAIMGEGVIDGRGGEKILGGSESWWQLANDARDNRHQQVPRLIDINHSGNFTLYRITLRNSPMFHVVFAHAKGFTVWNLKIDTPQNARNTDGVDPSAASDITITQSYIRTGDDNVALKGGDGPVTQMSVIHNHFYYGHGMSIGSETSAGVNHILVEDLTLDGTESGLRIKSNPTRGGLVDGVLYKNICIRASNHPIQLETAYNNPGAKLDAFPVYQNIHLQDVRISGGTQKVPLISLNGYDHTHRIGIQFDGVTLDHPTDYKFQINHADVTLGPGPVNFALTGSNVSAQDSTVTGRPSSATLPSCTAAFVPFPAAP